MNQHTFEAGGCPRPAERSPAAEGSLQDGRGGMFFGQYLLEHGAVSPEQLDEAVALQQDNKTLLGNMALNKAYLSRKQMEAVLAEQRSVNKNFGEITLEKGWMQPEQISELVEEQAKNHCFLGEALIRLGVLTEFVLHHHLETFRAREKTREKTVLKGLDDFEAPVVMRTAVDLTRDLFYSLGYMIKTLHVSGELPGGMSGECFLASQKRKKQTVDYFGLVLTPALVSLIAQGNLCTLKAPMQEYDQLETVSELIYNLNYMLCNELRDQGLKLKPGPSLNRSLTNLPEHRTAIVVTFMTVTDPFSLLYCLQ